MHETWIVNLKEKYGSSPMIIISTQQHACNTRSRWGTFVQWRISNSTEAKGVNLCEQVGAGV